MALDAYDAFPYADDPYGPDENLRSLAAVLEDEMAMDALRANGTLVHGRVDGFVRVSDEVDEVSGFDAEAPPRHHGVVDPRGPLALENIPVRFAFDLVRGIDTLAEDIDYAEAKKFFIGRRIPKSFPSPDAAMTWLTWNYIGPRAGQELRTWLIRVIRGSRS